MSMPIRNGFAALLLAFALAACTNDSHFEPPDVQGPAALVDDGGQPRLWVLSKQEETREESVGGFGQNAVGDWRTDTFFHFRLQAFDPVAARPLWTKTLFTIGDPDAKGPLPSRVIGSSVEARLLGQDGDRVWLLIGSEPFAVSAADGHVLADAGALQQRNPQLKGVLPTDATLYDFDDGLVLTTADARRFVVRGASLQAVEYVAAAPPESPAAPVQANGMPRVVPTRPFGLVPVRNATIGGRWIGLYSPKEAADAANDEFGRHLLWPYSVLDEGSMARRSFLRADIVAAQRFDEKFDRIGVLAPVPGAPTYLHGRFVADPHTDAALPMADPAGVLVWHGTRIDDAGRLALARLDEGLQPRWDVELPMSEWSLATPMAWWRLSDHLVVVGVRQSEKDYRTSREPVLVSVRLRDGALQAWNLEREAAEP